PSFPITNAYLNHFRFYNDFIDMINCFEKKLSKKDQENIYKKISSSFQGDEQAFFQTCCELLVVYYILRNFDNEFTYEPKYKGNFNPECSFRSNDFTVNIEVKTPNYSNRIHQESRNTIKIFPAERIPDKDVVINGISKIIDLKSSGYEGVEELKRLDNKLKDFLIHSQKKFPLGDNYFNILVIALEIIPDIDEWYSYIFGDNGIFTDSSYVDYPYDNVDAILLCTPIAGLKKWTEHRNINVWELENNINLLFLDPKKESTKKGKFYFNHAINMFGTLTLSFITYLQNLDSNLPKFLSTNEYIIHKQFDLSIVSNFVYYLQTRQSNNQ
ncbi:MAG: hypothetical protein MSH15_13505, partial [Oscillospiraceae bacterium]|nr:hypothetical protein [Oscillospiraceae bacterium]